MTSCSRHCPGTEYIYLKRIPDRYFWLPINPGFSGVIFDFDGTLVDSMGVWYEVDQRFCETYDMQLPENYVQEIAALDVVSMTPIDALNKLFELNEKAKRI